jgi:hypothetical protein
MFRGWQAVIDYRVPSLNLRPKNAWLGTQCRQSILIVLFRGVSPRSKQKGLNTFPMGAYASLVDPAHGDLNLIPGPYASKNFNEVRLTLPPDFSENYGCYGCALKGVCAERVGCRIPEAIQKSASLALHNRRQLQKVANHNQLHSAERTIIAAQLPEPGVNCIDNICSDHRDFIDDECFHTAKQYARVAAPSGKIGCIKDATWR